MALNQNISTIIFDFGGVIINLDLPQCIQNFKKMGVSNVEKYLSNFGQTGFFQKWEKGLIGLEEFREEIRKIAENKITDEQIDDAWCSFLTDIPEYKIELLKILRKKYKLYLLSNSNPLHIDVSAAKEFHKFGGKITDYFDKCFFSYEIGLTKPGEEIFNYVLKDISLSSHECLFIDDGLKNIETAAQMGFNTKLTTQNEDLLLYFKSVNLL